MRFVMQFVLIFNDLRWRFVNLLRGGKRKGMNLGPLQKYPKGLLGSEHDPVAGSYESGSELAVPQHAI
jgi:hypothetical protein